MINRLCSPARAGSAGVPRSFRSPDGRRGPIARAVIVAGAMLALAALPAAAQGVGLPIGTAAPPAALQTIDGKPVDLADWVGKGPVLIEFWATWCANCEELEPAMAAAKKKYGDQVRFLGVAVSLNQSPTRVKAYAERHQLPIEVLWDVDGKAADAYRAPATSYVVVVDKAGKVVYTGVGGKQDLDGAIRKALAP